MEQQWQQLYAVDPIKDCPHCTELDYEKFINKKFNEKCNLCENVGENWICLECQEIFCSRYVNEHMVQHNAETWHPIALSFSDLSYWCYSCDSYVISSKFDTVHKHFYSQKFGDAKESDVKGIIDKLNDLEIQKDEDLATESTINHQDLEDEEESKIKISKKSSKTSNSFEKTAKNIKMHKKSKKLKQNLTKKDAKIALEKVRPKVLEDSSSDEENILDRELFIEKLKNGEFKSINVMTGAGISVSSGIPDFRSPDTGLYPILKKRYDMDDPFQIFDIETFLSNPDIFYDFSRELNWDEYEPTPTHYFIGFLHKKKLLDNYITQNIDCLEYKAGIPSEKIVAAHGNLFGAECPE